MEKKPKIILERTGTDTWLSVGAYTGLAALWCMVIVAYKSLPQVIPTHFGFSGEANAFGDRSSIFIGPVIGTMLFIVMSAVAAYPHKLNYNREITPENAPYLYRMGVRIITYLRFSIILIFIVLEYLTIREAHTQGEGIGGWVIGLIMVLIHFPVFIMMIKMSSYGETK